MIGEGQDDEVISSRIFIPVHHFPHPQIAIIAQASTPTTSTQSYRPVRASNARSFAYTGFII
jgi:hypothetical protein